MSVQRFTHTWDLISIHEIFVRQPKLENLTSHWSVPIRKESIKILYNIKL